MKKRARSARAGHLGALKYLSVARTHAGCVRKLNEDAYLDRADVGLWAVADGMGGHEAGDVASATVINALSQVSEFRSAYALRHDVCLALHGANAQLRNHSDDLSAGVCGSTIATLLIHSSHFACV